MRGLFVTVYHPVTRHRWDGRTRANKLHVHCFIGSFLKGFLLHHREFVQHFPSYLHKYRTTWQHPEDEAEDLMILFHILTVYIQGQWLFSASNEPSTFPLNTELCSTDWCHYGSILYGDTVVRFLVLSHSLSQGKTIILHVYPRHKELGVIATLCKCQVQNCFSWSNIFRFHYEISRSFAARRWEDLRDNNRLKRMFSKDSRPKMLCLCYGLWPRPTKDAVHLGQL